MPVFLPNLKKNGYLEKLHMTLCIVGSRKLSEQNDYVSQGWGIFAPNLTIYGFDADADACNEANADLEKRNINWTEKHIPLALAESEGESTLYVTQHPMSSSLYPPNENYIERFSNLAEFMNLDFTIEVETTTLDKFCQQEEIEKVDFIQSDVQGADYNVLKGATQILERGVLAVEVEVIFSPLYLNQPLFASVDSFLREKEFTLFDLHLARRIRVRSPLHSKAHSGQVLWGEAFYFRDLIQEANTLDLQTPEDIFKLACIADVMNFPDYALELLEYLTINYGSNSDYNFADVIVESLAQFPDLLDQGLEKFPIVANIRDYLINYPPFPSPENK